MAGTKIEKIYEPLKAKKINIKRWTGDISLNVSLSIPEKKSTLKNVIQSLIWNIHQTIHMLISSPDKSASPF